MSLFDQISNDIKAAMLARDKQRLEALMGQIPSLKSLEVSYDFLPTCTMPVNVILIA